MKNIKSFGYFKENHRHYSDYETQNVEMNLLDDLKTNFRDWEDGFHNDQENAEELAGILTDRHPDEDPDYVRQTAFDWVGYNSEEFPEDFQ